MAGIVTCDEDDGRIKSVLKEKQYWIRKIIQ